jgi:hypothetical protein
MIPDPGEILRKRTGSATVVRILALVPLFAGVCIAAAWGYAANEDRLYAGEHTGYGVSVGIFVGFAVLVWALAPWHARRSVKMPKSVVCPACNYKIAGLTEARCPECGLPLTAEFIAKPGEKTPPPRDPDRATMRQMATAITRLLAMIVALATTPYLIYFTVEFVRATSGNSYHDYDELIFGLLAAGGVLVLAIGLFIFGRAISALIVPSRSAVGGPAEPPRRPRTDDPASDA